MSFPRHARYKECGVAGLSEVPEHWNVTPLKRVIQTIESGTSVNGTSMPAEDGEMGVLTTSCIQAGRFEPGENKAVVPADRHRASCPLKAGTLIVTRLNTIDPVGTAGYVSHAPATDGICVR